MSVRPDGGREGDAAEPEYEPWVGGPFRWRLGLRPLDLADWIEIGSDYPTAMAGKAEVRDRFPATVFTALPGATAACVEVRDAVVEHLTRRWPGDFERVGGVVVNRRTDERIPLDDLRHPLDVAGRLVQEDLVVMAAVDGYGDGREVFAAGSVCSPNRWHLAGKLGLALADVHAPVSRLNEQLADPIDRFFARLTPDKSYWRLGWGVIDTPDLYQPVDGTAAPLVGPPGPDDVYVRIERETLRRLPVTGCVLFTIRTYVRSFRDVMTSTRSGTRLGEAIAALPPDVARYKQVAPEFLSGIRAPDGRDPIQDRWSAGS